MKIKKIITLLALLQIMGFLLMLVYGTIMGIILFSIMLIPTTILIAIVKNKAYSIVNTAEYKEAIEDLKKEKEAYEIVKESLVHTSTLLGDILIENKEKF